MQDPVGGVSRGPLPGSGYSWSVSVEGTTVDGGLRGCVCDHVFRPWSVRGPTPWRSTRHRDFAVPVR